MLTKLSIAAELSNAFEAVMPDKLVQGDTTAYAALLNPESRVFFRTDAFDDDDDHSVVPGQTTAVAQESNARIIGYFSASQLLCYTTEELAGKIEDDQLPYS